MYSGIKNKSRLIPANLSQEQFAKQIDRIKELFSERWLTDGIQHPLQELWARRDLIASTELALISYCLGELNSVNPIWVAQIVNKLKDLKNVHGAVFEVISLGILHHHTRNISLPNEGNYPGIDGILSYGDKQVIRLSIKNNSNSVHHKTFRLRCEELEGVIKDALKHYKIHGISIFINLERYVGDIPKWDEFKQKVFDCFSSFVPNHPDIYEHSLINGKMYLGDLSDEDELLEINNSYSLIISSPFHKNEERNLISKIDEARVDFSNIKQEYDKINVVFIKIPDIIHFSVFKEWVETYMKNDKQKSLAGIIAYQSSIVNLPHSPDEKFFCVSYNLAVSDKWNVPDNIIHLGIPFQLLNVAIESPKREIKFGDTFIDISRSYVFEREVKYTKVNKNKSGQAIATISADHTGSTIHYRAIERDGDYLILSPIQAPSNKFLLI